MSMRKLRDNLEFVKVSGHRMHIFRAGSEAGSKLVFMSGSGTVAPMYDFKVLYEKLMSSFRVIVIEKFGYGYSDLYDAPCDVDTVVDLQRKALVELGEKGPYILLPHSMSGLEAIRWSQSYPDEVAGIVGLDMALPKTYQEWGSEGLQKRIQAMKKLRRLHEKGLLFWYPLNKRSLTKDEAIQQRLLWKRNAMNDCFISAAKEVLKNAETAASGGRICCPLLMFVSNGKQVSPNWISHQKGFARQENGRLIHLSCGHYVHYYESEMIAERVKEFVKELPA